MVEGLREGMQEAEIENVSIVNELWEDAKVEPADVVLSAHSVYGVADMVGSVRGWVADWYLTEYYTISPDRNPKGPETGFKKVVRGSSWMAKGKVSSRIALRRRDSPSNRKNYAGFRCARTESEQD